MSDIAVASEGPTCWLAEDEDHWYREFGDAITSECRRLQVVRIRSLHEALDAIEEVRSGDLVEPAIVVTNLNLMGSDNTPDHGVALVQAMAAVAPAVPVVALTARKDWTAANDAGFAALLRKDIGADIAARAICDIAFPRHPRFRRATLTPAGDRDLGAVAEIVEGELVALAQAEETPEYLRPELDSLCLQIRGWRMGSRRSPLVFGDYLALFGDLLSSASGTSTSDHVARLIATTTSAAAQLVEPDPMLAATSAVEASELLDQATDELVQIPGVDVGVKVDDVLDAAERWVDRWERLWTLGKRTWTALPVSVRVGVPLASAAVRYYGAVAAFLLHAFQ